MRIRGGLVENQRPTQAVPYLKLLRTKYIIFEYLNLYKNSNLVIFPGLGAFDHLKWTYDGAFEQVFGPGRGHLHKNFPKIEMPGGLPVAGGGGDVEASI